MSISALSAQVTTRRFHVLVIDSYHEGFAWSEAQADGIRAALVDGRIDRSERKLLDGVARMLEILPADVDQLIANKGRISARAA